MKRLLIALPVAAALLSGCGGQPSPAPAAPTSSSTAAQTAATLTAPVAPAPGMGGVSVAQEGKPPQLTEWYVRVENDEGKNLAEAAFPNGPISFSQDFPPGNYRLISWHRQCNGSCPATGEAGLGPLQEACGAKVAFVAGTRLSATVVIEDDGACSVRTK